MPNMMFMVKDDRVYARGDNGEWTMISDEVARAVATSILMPIGRRLQAKVA